MPRKIGGSRQNTDKVDPAQAGTISTFNYDQEQQNILGRKLETVDAEIPASVIDAGEIPGAVDIDNDITPFPDPPEEIPQSEVGNTLHSKEFYEKQTAFAPAIEVSPNKPNSQINRIFRDDHEKIDHIQKELAKPASERDLSMMDESIILEMPQIKAASFEIVDMLNLKPKDKNIRFKWVNCKNFLAGNMGRYLALGFVTAHKDDVDQARTPIHESMIDGTQVKYDDVVLMKVPVMRLMELYKANMIRSISKLVKTKEQGLAEAKRQFKSDISATPGASGIYNKYKEATGKDPVEFFITEG